MNHSFDWNIISLLFPFPFVKFFREDQGVKSSFDSAVSKAEQRLQVSGVKMMLMIMVMVMGEEKSGWFRMIHLYILKYKLTNSSSQNMNMNRSSSAPDRFPRHPFNLSGKNIRWTKPL